jgi:hypothetical protein
MKVGGNLAMIEWWGANSVDARAPIAVKYAHPATQQYREKIKAAVAGKEYVAPAKNSSKPSLSKSSSGTASSPALSKQSSTSSSSSSLSSSSGRKPRSKKSQPASSSGGSVGTMFSFGDDSAARTNTASKSSDSDDEAFESFVSAKATSQTVAKPAPQNVPDYSDARLRNYSSATSFGSDDLDGTNAARKAEQQQQASTDDIFSALSTGWARVAQVASTTKDKLAESTAGLKQRVEQSQISERATSFIASLWSGLDPAEPAPVVNQQTTQQAPQQRERAEIDGENNVDAWLDRPSATKSADGEKTKDLCFFFFCL